MARTAITVQEISRTGVTEALVAANAAGGNSFPNDGRTYLSVVTTGTTSNVTVSVPITVDSQVVTPRVVACTGTARYKIGPFPPNTYNQADGAVYVDFSAVTGVTIGAFRLP